MNYLVSCGVTARRGKSTLHLTFDRQLIEAASAETAPAALLSQAMLQLKLTAAELANEPVVAEAGPLALHSAGPAQGAPG